MPGRDRTGPTGFGPMSGRGMGWCGRTGGSPYYGRGRFDMFGWGRGRDWRHRYCATGAPGWGRPGRSGQWAGPPPYWGWDTDKGELDSLKEYAAGLEQELSNIRNRMTELEGEQQAP